MVEIFKQTPVPIAGLMLGLAGTGNLILSYGSHYRYLAGILAVVVSLLIIGKIIFAQKGFISELKNPIIASVAPAFSMAVIILASYLIPFTKQLALYIWYGGIILHSLLVILFSIRFLLNFDLKKVYPSYFIVYVGIVVASVTAPAFDQIQLGQAIFWFGFIAYMLLLPIVTYRVFKIGEIKKPALPTISIFTAPAGLCLTGYMNAFPDKNMLIFGWLLLLTLIMIIAVTIYLPKMLSVGFYPSYSAFTFPFVITAMGLKEATEFLKLKFGISLLNHPTQIVEALAVTLVIFVLLKYSIYLTQNSKEKIYQNKKAASRQL
ncbi:TDT family transporter [Natroniella sulfidigena]|uniref:TDT family transporter n=1 Tax=Natroniella sulfidigena TaxID=723921 RepID=UPI00200B3843|nr:TDT family transporter [Natroniella sulfidigena]MCK8817862.1 TDT family transporter [Natroniella sulfidigena]